MLKRRCLCRPPPLSPLASQALSTSKFPSTGVGDRALLFSRARKAQSLDQGYPRESVAELRTEPPRAASPRLRLADVLQHLPAQPKTPLEISWPMQKDSRARNPKLSTPALSGAKRHRRSPPALAGSAPPLQCQGTKRPGGGHCPSRSPLPGELEVQPLRRWGWEGGEGTGHKAGTRQEQESSCQRITP